MNSSFIGCLILFFAVATNAFAPQRPHASRSAVSSIQLHVAKPKFNKDSQQWEPAAADDGTYPYDAVGALLRHGPSPFLKRVTNPSGYEQDVLAYMANVGVSRAEATGNVDAKLNNAMDWAYQKMEEKNGKPKVDYTVLDRKRATLAVVWAVFITPLTVDVLSKTFLKYSFLESVGL